MQIVTEHSRVVVMGCAVTMLTRIPTAAQVTTSIVVPVALLAPWALRAVVIPVCLKMTATAGRATMRADLARLAWMGHVFALKGRPAAIAAVLLITPVVRVSAQDCTLVVVREHSAIGELGHVRPPIRVH